MKKKTILVTGGAGYIGSACVRALCDEGYEVVVIDNLSNGDRKYVDERANFFEGDVLNQQFLGTVFEEVAPQLVIHAAALKAVGESEEQPERYFTNNVIGTFNVLSTAARFSVTKFIFSSTATVYKPTEDGTYRETDPLGSVNVYGSGKLMAEKFIEEFHRTGLIPSYAIFRYFNVAGDAGLNFKEKNPQNLLPLLVESAATGKKLTVFGDDYPTYDGTCVRDYIHVTDIVRAHQLAMKEEVSGIFNLGTSCGTSVLDLITAFEKILGRKVLYEIGGRRTGDPAILRAISVKAKKELGWEPKLSLEDILVSLQGV